MNHKENAKFVGRQLLIVLISILILLAVFAIGLVIGYGVIGDGQNPWSILSPGKWQEIIGKLTGQ